MSDVGEKFEAVIGLEVHAQLLTKTKLFCRCANQFDAENNANVCPVCTGQPGALPVLNRQAVELGIRAALATQSQISEESIFARKNYFYPDLPKGYQISQYEKPYCEGGKIKIHPKAGEPRWVHLTRIHLEEDAGKNIHKSHGTLVNLNRACVPLIEIVSEPEMSTPEEAGQYLRVLREMLRYVDICDGNMEEGSFRCDANVSIRPKGQSKLGTKVELKNMNSFRFVEKALEYEIERQIEAIQEGSDIAQETRAWNVEKGITESMRGKEEAHDYRYFPEPDLPVLIISKEWIDSVAQKMPELPEIKRERFRSKFGLSAYDVETLTGSKELASYFEVVAGQTKDPKLSANWVANELLGKLHASGKSVESSPIAAEQLASLVKKVASSEISGKMAKTIFETMFETGKDPEIIIEEEGLAQINDASQLEPVIKKIIQDSPDQVKSYKDGKGKLFGYFVGQVMKATKGQANPGLVNQIVKQLLDQQ